MKVELKKQLKEINEKIDKLEDQKEKLEYEINYPDLEKKRKKYVNKFFKLGSDIMVQILEINEQSMVVNWLYAGDNIAGVELFKHINEYSNINYNKMFTLMTPSTKTEYNKRLNKCYEVIFNYYKEHFNKIKK